MSTTQTVLASRLQLEAFREKFSALDAKKQESVLRLLTLASRTCDQKKKEENLGVAAALIYDERRVCIKPPDVSPEGKEQLQTHREHVAANIKRLREAKGMTQEELANKAQLYQTHVSRLENAQHAATHKTIRRIAKALGVKRSQIDTSF